MPPPKRKRLTEQHYLQKLQSGPEHLKECMAYFYGREDLRRVASLLFKRILKRHSPILDWRDVFSEALHRLMKSLIEGKYQGKSKLSSYFYRICFNYCNELLRKEQSKKVQLGELTVEQKLDDTEDEEVLLRAILEKQSTQCQKVFQLMYFQTPRWDVRAIAEELNMSNPRSVSTTLNRCKKKLIKALKSHSGVKRLIQKYLKDEF